MAGSGFIGSCTITDTLDHKEMTFAGEMTDETALLKFFTSKVDDGKQVVNANLGQGQPWSWFVTEE